MVCTRGSVADPTGLLQICGAHVAAAQFLTAILTLPVIVSGGNFGLIAHIQPTLIETFPCISKGFCGIPMPSHGFPPIPSGVHGRPI